MTRRAPRIAGLRLVREELFPAPAGYSIRHAVRSPRETWTFMQPYAARETVEVMWLLALDAQHRIIEGAPIVISRGILNSALVHPREVYRSAIVAGAAAIILVHNHPSGDPTPSGDDRLITGSMVSAGRMLDLPLHDHIICGDGCYTSFAEAGLL